MTTRLLFCCGCRDTVEVRLTDGSEVYPHRKDLAPIPFWKCDICGNFVGCHHKTQSPTRPLGSIPTPEVKKIRQRVHVFLDPFWKGGGWPRKTLYRTLARALDIPEYHTADIRTVEEGIRVLGILNTLPPRASKDPS